MEINLFYKKQHILSDIDSLHTKLRAPIILPENPNVLEKNSLTDLERDIKKSLGSESFAREQWEVVQSYIFSQKVSAEDLEREKEDRIVTIRSKMEIIDFPGFSETGFDQLSKLIDD